MITVRIEHKIASYEGWKKAFESDPINRKQSGVKRYRIYRPVEDPNFVTIDLEFDNLEQAQSTRAALLKVLPRVEGSIIFGAQVNVLDEVESKEL